MLLEKMRAKRAQVLEDARGLRKYPGTGYHDNDPLGPLKHPDPVGRRDARIDEHVVAFKQQYETVLVDEDAKRVAELIAAFAAEHAPMLTQHGLDQDSRTVIEAAVEYAGRPLMGDCFVARNAQWNTIVAIINAQGIGVTVTGV